MVNERDELRARFRELVAELRRLAPDLLAELLAEAALPAAPPPPAGARASRGAKARPVASAAPAAVPAPGADVLAWHGLVGISPPMLELRQWIARFGPAPAPVLITGESGTGKERVAHALHAVSPRAARTFVAENCAAIPDTLLESVLFGHKRGAFTGAIADHPGHFVHAHEGTLFLDEIGEMKPPMQAKLLRALQEGEVRAVGDSKTRKVDVRVIAATNQDLEARVRSGQFREDLYYRLNVLRIALPPLRDRGDDIVRLAEVFLAGAAAGRGLVLGEAAKATLLAARWPGNVRQLQNEMQRVAALADGPEVTPGDLTIGG